MSSLMTMAAASWWFPVGVVAVAMVSSVRLYRAIARDLFRGEGRSRWGFSAREVIGVTLPFPMGIAVLYLPTATQYVLEQQHLALGGPGHAVAYVLAAVTAVGLLVAATRSATH
ncbi:hypothetical protein AB0N09_28080 [Streptomyces erythrochromogenes]|uniref:hypothetical protein n=1 Tax=Streptomyces erythrochromogenes TaxID=285574 RepID=UPI00341234A7